MNLTCFRPEMRANVKNKTTQSTSDLSTKHQTSEIYLRATHLMSCWYIKSDVINQCAELHIPTKTVRHFRKHNKPWMTNDLKRLIRQRSKFFPDGARQTMSDVKLNTISW